MFKRRGSKTIAVYKLKYGKVSIGIFVEIDDEILYIPNREEADKLPSMVGYPAGLFHTVDEKSGMYVGKERVHMWAKDRLGIRRSRMLPRDISPWEMIKRVEGRSGKDRYWLEN